MIRRIARKEIVDTLRDGRFRVLASVVLAISLASFAAGWMHYRAVEAQHREAQQATRAQWLAQPPTNPHSAAHYGVYAFKPTSRLSMIDMGIEPYVGVAAWLEAHTQDEFKYRPAQDRTALQRFGDLTVAEAFLTLLPLFIVLMTFNAMSGEREQGTLHHLMSLGVSPRQLAAGKALGVAGALTAIVVPVAFISVAGLALTADLGGLAGDVPRAAVLGLVYGAYLATFIAIGIGVSAAMRTSRAALLVLLAFWFANSLIVPRAASEMAAAWHPTPSAVVFHAAVDDDIADRTVLEARLDRRRRELMHRYGVSAMDLVPVDFSGISLQESEEHGNEVFDAHFGSLFDTYAAQNRTREWAGLVAPLVATRTLSMNLAGTDFAHHRAFVDAAEHYRRAMQRVLNGDIVAHATPNEVYLAGAELWSRIPPFEYEAPGLGWALRQHVVSLAIAGAWIVAAVVFAGVAVGRAAAVE